MHQDYNNSEFEQFLRENANQYRMYPSDKVWKGINHSLHTRHRWYGLGLALLFLTATTVTWMMLGSAGKNKPVADTSPLTRSALKKAAAPEQTPLAAGPVKLNAHNRHANAPVANDHTVFFTDRITETGMEENSIAEVSPMTLPDKPAGISLNSETDAESNTLIARNNKPVSNLVAVNPQTRMNTIRGNRYNQKSTAETSQSIPVITGLVNDNNPVDASAATENTVAAQSASQQITQSAPYTIESVVNQYRYKKSRSKLSWEVFVTPTVSYRKLSDNQEFLAAAARSNSISPQSTVLMGDINSAVTHKPDLGMEIGFTTGIPITRSLRFTTGLQLNVSKYDIRAFNHAPEMATISLNTGGGAGNSVSTVTSYRNLDINSSNWLQNLYVSVSMPVGAELKLVKARNAYLGIGGSLQPTYIVSDRVYLISTDYKNYAEVPSLIRRWNMNAGFETFVGYNLGRMKWRIGPQVRYQLKSSFVSQYPVKENLFDYGLKLGLMFR